MSSAGPKCNTGWETLIWQLPTRAQGLRVQKSMLCVQLLGLGNFSRLLYFSTDQYFSHLERKKNYTNFQLNEKESAACLSLPPSPVLPEYIVCAYHTKLCSLKCNDSLYLQTHLPSTSALRARTMCLIHLNPSTQIGSRYIGGSQHAFAKQMDE